MNISQVITTFSASFTSNEEVYAELWDDAFQRVMHSPLFWSLVAFILLMIIVPTIQYLVEEYKTYGNLSIYDRTRKEVKKESRRYRG